MSVFELPVVGVGLQGTVPLVAGVATITDARIKSTSLALVSVASPLGTLGVGYKAVCSAGQLVITGYTALGATQVLDTSSVQYMVVF